MADRLGIWAIYDRPRDYPEHVVARFWEAVNGHPRPAPIVCIYSHVLAARQDMQRKGLAYMARVPGDDPAILETWLKERNDR